MSTTVASRSLEASALVSAAACFSSGAAHASMSTTAASRSLEASALVSGFVSAATCFSSARQHRACEHALVQPGSIEHVDDRLFIYLFLPQRAAWIFLFCLCEVVCDVE
jgi:hypothetical protein